MRKKVRTVPRSLSLYPRDWEKLDEIAELLETIVGYRVTAPGVVRNLLQYGDQLVREARALGLKRL